MMTSRPLLAVAGCAALMLSPPARAADYPSQPIHFINPAPPGGGTDIVLRIYAEKMEKDWGQQVLVEARPGAQGMLAATDVAKAAPDGYTLFGTNDTIAINPAMEKKMPYDTLHDFAPVGLLSAVDMGLFAAPTLPVNTTQELEKYAKANPGKLTYASIGKGSPQYLVGELFKQQAGVNIRHIPYKDRSAIASDVMSGRVSIMISSIAGVDQLVKAGKLKAFGVTSAARSPVLPDVPTMQESGLPHYEYFSWIAIFAPKGTPQAIVDKLNAEVLKISKMPDVQEKIARTGSEVMTDTPEQLGELLKSDLDRWTKLFAEAGN